MTDREMTYKGTGIDYDAMDPFKRAAILASQATDRNAERMGYRAVGWSRGESCFLLEGARHYLAQVEEGLGTKNIIADMLGFGYGEIGQDAVAMIVNDMITVGALPLSLAMHLAVGDGKWFQDQVKVERLIAGWRHGCDLAGAVWGGGETPTLRDIVYPNGAVISGSAIGIIEPKSRAIQPRIQNGDRIVFLFSSGVHANGLTLARDISGHVDGGYAAKIDGTEEYGAALLQPTRIYAPVVEACLDHEIPIHYAVNITGHGWRKLMRAPQSFAYVVEHLPPLQPVFNFIMERGPVSKREMYGTYNMGAGFALYVPEGAAEATVILAEEKGVSSMAVGYIESAKERRVVISPEGIEFEASTLQVR